MTQKNLHTAERARKEEGGRGIRRNDTETRILLPDPYVVDGEGASERASKASSGAAYRKVPITSPLTRQACKRYERCFKTESGEMLSETEQIHIINIKFYDESISELRILLLYSV